VYVSVNQAAFTLLDDAVGDVTSYTTNTVSTGSNYKFKVQAQNGVGDSPTSSESETIIAATVPDPPTTLGRVYADGTMITIDWEAPTFTGGIPITDYKVVWDYASGGSDYDEIASTTTNDRLYTQDSNIIGGMTYSFKVIATNSIGDSDPSEALSVIAAQTPATPDAPTKKSADTTQITIQWTPPNSRGSPISEYEVYWNGGGSSTTFVKIADLTVPTTEY
jgi:titin